MKGNKHMNINTNRSEKNIQNAETLTNQESFGTLELADADLAIINGACGCEPCGALIGIGLSLGFGLGCQNSYDPTPFGGYNYEFGGRGSYCAPTPCHSGCYDPCR
jgi:hypothetical protein